MTSLVCATWNVNSVRARLQIVTQWLEQNSVDVLVLQEIKCETEVFPSSFFEELGYQCAVFGQKTYNGVAILSRCGLEDVNKGLPTWDVPQARYIDALVGGRLRVASVYVPNGQAIDSQAYKDKLEFMGALRTHLHTLLSWDEPIAIGGDWNIAPRACDVHPDWQDELLCSPRERSAFQRILDAGFHDTRPDHTAYTWWDYRAGAFKRNFGLRIDHWLTTNLTVTNNAVDRSPRELPKPSDHAPVSICIEI